MSLKKITNNSSGIYTREIDLTIIQESAGTFAGASLGLTEKGPAFEIMASADYDERTLRMGGLNPAFKSSYFAREFLAQAGNFKDVRILGLEGYNEEPSYEGTENKGGYDKCFSILYDVPGASTAGMPLTITNVTGDGVTPIEVTAVIEGSLAIVDGDTVIIEGVLGNTAANGQYVIANVAENAGEVTFDLVGTTGNGEYLGGGTVKPRTPVVAGSESIAAILKPRRTAFTQYGEIDYVLVEETAQLDGTTGATDDLFKLTMFYKGNQDTWLR